MAYARLLSTYVRAQLNRRLRGSEFVQQAVVIAVVVLALVLILSGVADQLAAAYRNISSCISQIASGQTGGWSCGGIAQKQ